MAHALSRALRIAVAAAALACGAVLASPSDSITGSLSSSMNDGAGTFSCLGTPTCSGVTNITIAKNNGCTNSTFSFASTITFANLDLSHTGSFSGSFTIAQIQQGHTQNPDGSCTYDLVPGATWPYDGTWNATTGTGTIAIHSIDGSGQADTFSGAFSAQLSVNAPPVFPMAISGSVTPATVNMQASFAPRPQDTGTQSYYAFAHAPSNLVSGASPKAVNGEPPSGGKADDAIVCVLAQVTADGHLVAVSASTMQSFLTGVVSSQGQTVQILNNVSTPNVAGATFFVGYGTSAASMLASGIYQDALTVPGPVQHEPLAGGHPADPVLARLGLR